MPGDPNVLSSDLDAARAISRRLRGGRGPVAPEAPPFEPSSAPPARPHATTAPRVAADLPSALWETGNLGSRFWNELLKECLGLARVERAIAAFAVDGRGLCIAQVGDLQPDALEATGSRLVIALEQADRMESFADKRLAAMFVGFDDQWLTGMVLSAGSGSRVIVGIIAHEPLSDASRGMVLDLAGEALLRG